MRISRTASGIVVGIAMTIVACGGDDKRADNSPCAVNDGQCIFRHDTFGDEQLWTDTLRLHELVQTLPPTTALAVGLKVDADAVPADVLAAADLSDPATTVALIELGAVVGVRGTVEAGTITKIGITCALCHSTVDNSVTAGVGKRLDGWPNHDLDPGAIISLTPGLSALTAKLGVDHATAKTALGSWGPGRYDARFNQDTESHAVLLPPAYGLRDVALETYTGEGPVSYWNAYVAITQMHGHGHFADPRIGVDVNNSPPDLVSSKLAALREYQFSLDAPEAIPGSFDAQAARRGRAVFNGVARCASCHLAGSLSDVNAGRLHPAAEVGQDPEYALRSATKLYRTTPLRGLWHPPQLEGPYFHDGKAATLGDAVEHYVDLFDLELSNEQKRDLVEYLKTL
jgi:cytochrome c553